VRKSSHWAFLWAPYIALSDRWFFFLSLSALVAGKSWINKFINFVVQHTHSFIINGHDEGSTHDDTADVEKDYWSERVSEREEGEDLLFSEASHLKMEK
jgi:hypothetical protein